MTTKQPKNGFRINRLTKEQKKLAWKAPDENAGVGWNTGGGIVAAGADFETLDTFGCYQKRRTEIE